jgi:hypothetical protein
MIFREEIALYLRDVTMPLERKSEQYEREAVLKPPPNWGKFTICYRNFRSELKEYGR